MKKRSYTPASRGTTMTELLVVLVIISLLATIAVPVYVNKSRQAQIAVARAEIREIAQALNQCAILHGFIVPLQMLDDLAPGLRSGGGTVPVDDLDNEADPVYLIDPIGDIVNQVGNQLTLENRLGNSRVMDLYETWAGPFLSSQRVYGKDPNREAQESDVRRDYLLDPWGQPYRLYSPIGLVGSNAQSTDPDSWDNDTTFDGQLTYTDARFDRFAIVSYGPDTTSGSRDDNPDDIGDDVVHLLMGMISESSFRAFY
ncbi:MAG TPA: prepilin-type N-terminal cleavage/methylation domain-containing protein [Sumerlaeia bacterium]|nr:prepilin-type N-terminal cleavage/methylation domain-containing protein [Sumerlaeia bacterium]